MSRQKLPHLSLSSVVQVQKDLVDLSKHCIHDINALVSLDRAECFVLEKQTHKNSYIVV